MFLVINVNSPRLSVLILDSYGKLQTVCLTKVLSRPSRRISVTHSQPMRSELSAVGQWEATQVLKASTTFGHTQRFLESSCPIHRWSLPQQGYNRKLSFARTTVKPKHQNKETSENGSKEGCSRYWPRHHLLLCRCFPARKGKRTAATYLAKRFFLIFANVFHSKSS